MSATQAPLRALFARLDARAAGWWRVVGDRLERVAFEAAADMPAETAGAFEEATRSVPLSLGDLGIVRAAVSGATAVSRAAELPPDAGSGLWLRRFRAARSVAVPLADAAGRVTAVVSVALADPSPDDPAVAEAIRNEAAGWGHAAPGATGRTPSDP